MEKIYMSDNNSSGKNLNSKYHISIALSFVVAIFAIVSLIAVGFNQVSYAAPAEAGTNSFKPAAYKEQVSTDGSSSGTTYSPVGVMSEASSSTFFNVPVFYIDEGQTNPVDITAVTPVFCIGKHSEDAGVGLDYSKEGPVDEQHQNAILYILNHSNVYNSQEHIIPADKGGNAKNNRLLEIYATQVAIWMVLNDPDVISNSTVVADILSANKYVVGIAGTTAVGTSGVIYEGNLFSYINAVVQDAKNNASPKKLAVNIEDGVSAVDGTNYYQTGKITIAATPSNDLLYYDLSLEGVEGAFPVDGEGKEIKNLSNITSMDTFYVRFPKDKITEEKTELKVNVTGRFKNVQVPYIYGHDSNQKLVTVENGEGDLPAYNTLTIVRSPDTANSTSQTIYFIGLIVLLCGVGIIYANSKSAKSL